MGARAHIRHFIGQQRDIARSETGDCSLSRPRHAREQKSASVTNRAGGMQQEAAFLRQDKAVDNAQDRIYGIGIGRLANPSFARCGVPFGAEIGSAQRPQP